MSKGLFWASADEPSFIRLFVSGVCDLWKVVAGKTRFSSSFFSFFASFRLPFSLCDARPPNFDFILIPLISRIRIYACILLKRARAGSFAFATLDLDLSHRHPHWLVHPYIPFMHPSHLPLLAFRHP